MIAKTAISGTMEVRKKFLHGTFRGNLLGRAREAGRGWGVRRRTIAASPFIATVAGSRA